MHIELINADYPDITYPTYGPFSEVDITYNDYIGVYDLEGNEFQFATWSNENDEWVFLKTDKSCYFFNKKPLVSGGNEIKSFNSLTLVATKRERVTEK